MSASLPKVKAKTTKITLKRILQDKRKRIRLFLLTSGILFIVLGLLLSPPSKPQNTASPPFGNNGKVTSFSQEPVIVEKGLLEAPKPKEKAKNPPLRVIIPSLKIDLPVKEAKVVKGYWEVFDDSAGFGLGSAYPEENGNQVVFAHAREGLFLPLKEAKPGQKIYILTKDLSYAYTINEIKEVLPQQVESIRPTKEAILTLYTCSGFADSKRLIVVAKRG